MPICNNPSCNKHFPTSIRVGEKYQTFNRRKYCFDCSPFKARQGQKIKASLEGFSGSDSKCEICGKEYEYNRSNRRGSSRTVCGSCHVNKRRKRVKLLAIEYKGSKCSLCGYSRCTGALVFHHLDPLKKSFGIGGNHNRGWTSVEKELDKCILLCNNCHVEVHMGVTTLAPNSAVE